jgi:hypothetical protein
LTKGKRFLDLQISGKDGILLQKKREARAPENVPNPAKKPGTPRAVSPKTSRKWGAFRGGLVRLAMERRSTLSDIPENVPKINFGEFFGGVF